MGFETKKPEFKSYLCCSLAMCHWTSHLTSLGLYFLLCKPDLTGSTLISIREYSKIMHMEKLILSSQKSSHSLVAKHHFSRYTDVMQGKSAASSCGSGEGLQNAPPMSSTFGLQQYKIAPDISERQLLWSAVGQTFIHSSIHIINIIEHLTMPRPVLGTCKTHSPRAAEPESRPGR